MKDVKVAAVQMEHADGDKAVNFDKIMAFTVRAARLVDPGAQAFRFLAGNL